MQLSLAGLVTPPGQARPASAAQTPSTAATPTGVCNGMFTFTIRKADDSELGLFCSRDEQDKVLRVDGVKEGSAVQAWNRLCEGGTAEKMVLPGDRIVGVNGVSYDPDDMLKECQSKQLLKLTVIREGWPLGNQAQNQAAASLRANAKAFVPWDTDAAANR